MSTRPSAISRTPFATFSTTADIWKEVITDANSIDSGIGASEILDFPLWKSGGAEPRWAAENWALLKDALAGRDNWNVWLEWYEDRLAGRSRGEAYELIFASVPESEWDKGPAAANAWIAARLRELNNKARRQRKVATPATPAEPATPAAQTRSRKPSAKAKSPRPKTATGRAVIANMPAIILNSTALIALLDSEISRLKNERRNDPEHEETIARLIAIRDECIAFREAVEIFAENKTNEEVVVQKANAFWKPFQDFWANDCSGIISGSAQLGIIAGGAELIKLAGARPSWRHWWRERLSRTSPSSRFLSQLRECLRA